MQLQRKIRRAARGRLRALRSDGCSIPAPLRLERKGTVAALKKALGKDLVAIEEAHGEIVPATVKTDRLVGA
jgi:hypothetical protein